MGFFISDALAAASTTANAPAGEGSFSLILMVAIFVAFYFMLIRPQNRRAKEHRNLVNQIKKGDEIITAGGILGKVTAIDEQYIKLSIADNVEISMQRSAINSVIPKGTLKSI